MDDLTLSISRHLRASPEKVWQAWTDPAILPRWFGPQGYSCRTREIDLSPGGVWRFDMIGPDGTVWANRHRFISHTPMTEIRFLMDDDDTSPRQAMQVVVTLTPVDGGTLLTQVTTMPTLADKKAAIAFGALDLGQTTLAKLAAIVEG